MEADGDAWEPVGGAKSSGGRGRLRNRRVETELVAGTAAGNPFVVASVCVRVCVRAPERASPPRWLLGTDGGGVMAEVEG